MLWQKLSSCPPEVQAEILDFIDYLVAKKGGQFAGSVPQPGLGKNMFSYVAEDFDAPLEDFREYME
ncbi:MAG: DUF2281 domain-containing protein [Bacteroidetes bacterium]|nr:DUF2281 domain-containing protein [Bacteroidota bacterium]MCW5897281.1 DUF2281 domain-containing protein [Bacteroidota bacterium]